MEWINHFAEAIQVYLSLEGISAGFVSVSVAAGIFSEKWSLAAFRLGPLRDSARMVAYSEEILGLFRKLAYHQKTRDLATLRPFVPTASASRAGGQSAHSPASSSAL
jgi:hypothetical protein